MKHIVVMSVIAYFSCVAMDNKINEIEFISDKIYPGNKVHLSNNTKHEIFTVLSIRNAIFQMLGKGSEGALKLLLKLCKEDVIHGRSKLNSSKGAQVFLHKKDIKDIGDDNLKLDLQILLHRGLIKKNDFGYLISFVVQDVVRSSLRIDEDEMITMEEPTDCFSDCQVTYGRNWQKELRKLIKRS